MFVHYQICIQISAGLFGTSAPLQTRQLFLLSSSVLLFFSLFCSSPSPLKNPAELFCPFSLLLLPFSFFFWFLPFHRFFLFFWFSLCFLSVSFFFGFSLCFLSVSFSPFYLSFPSFLQLFWLSFDPPHRFFLLAFSSFSFWLPPFLLSSSLLALTFFFFGLLSYPLFLPFLFCFFFPLFGLSSKKLLECGCVGTLCPPLYIYFFIFFYFIFFL